MKRIYFYIIVTLISFLNFGIITHAQSPCESVSVEVLAMNPQSGPHSYFGIRVSISQAYWENITVTGYIWDGPDDHNYNTNHPYTLTIVAGYLTAETAVNFYETGPAAEGAASITSVSSCNIGFSYAPHISGLYDQLGGIHNAQLDKVYSYLLAYSDTMTQAIPLQTINAHIFNQLASDLDISDVSFPQFYVGDTILKTTGYTSLSLKNYIYNLTGHNVSSQLENAFAILEELFWSEDVNDNLASFDTLVENRIPTISDVNEKAAFASAASVAKNSLMYWQEKLEDWEDLATILDGKLATILDGKINTQDIAAADRYDYGENTVSLNNEFNFENHNNNQEGLSSEISNISMSGQSKNTRFFNIGKDVAYADVAGAAVGAVRGAIIGLTGGTVVIPVLGTGVGGACGVLIGTIGGAIGSSVVEAVNSFIKWLINW